VNKIETLIYSGVAAAGLGVGFTVGYTVSKKHHEAIADAEIESVKETYSKARENLEKPPLEQIVDPATVVITEETVKLVAAPIDTAGLGYISAEDELGREPAPEVVEAVKHNVFRKYSDVHDGVEAVESTVDEPEDQVEATLAISRESDDTPYLISIDDFHDSTWDHHTHLSVTYYVGDKVLMDEREQIVPNIGETIGEWAVENFGLLSLDPEVVYVRNKRLHADFEVTRDASSYQEQILGLKN
jgi:hypothetical protein